MIKAADVHFSPRERAIVNLLADGYSIPDIAKKLFVAPQTAKFHMTNIYRKMGVSSGRQAVAWCYKSGYVTIDQPTLLDQLGLWPEQARKLANALLHALPSEGK